MKTKHGGQTSRTNAKKNIKNKRRGHQWKGVILHYDNARPHTAAQTKQSPNEADHQQSGQGTAPSSPLQPSPCPFRLSPEWSFERVHKSTKFESDDKVKSVVSDWVRHQTKDFYAEGIRKLVHRWEKCMKLIETMLKTKLSFYLNYKSLY